MRNATYVTPPPKKKRIKTFYVYLVSVVNDEFNLKYYIETEFLYIEHVKI